MTGSQSASKPPEAGKQPEAKPPETPATQLLDSLRGPDQALAAGRRGEPSDWLTRNRNYLEENGWLEAGSNEAGLSTWVDPLGTNDPGKKVDAVVLRTKGGGKETIQQLRFGPCPWTYSMDEALAFQRGRDRAKPKVA